MIFGNNPKGDMFRSGAISFFGDGTSSFRSGNMLFDDKNPSVKSGNMLFGRKGTIMKMGSNMYSTPNGTYTRSGSVLFGPNGKSWSGITSDEDCEDIINHDL